MEAAGAPGDSSCWDEPESWIHTEVFWEPPTAMGAGSGVQSEVGLTFLFPSTGTVSLSALGCSGLGERL